MAPPEPFPSAYVNKTVTIRFFGAETAFKLSHGLFSSFDVDAGTRLLLKVIAARVDLGSLRSALDVGCGVGVIGLCVAHSAPRARVFLQDRDALAAAFARENAAANGIGNAQVDCALAFRGLVEPSFDLVASNLPAKAGAPVLHSFFQTIPHVLASGGSACVVIVTPLEKLAREAIAAAGCAMVYEERTRQHAVFVFQGDRAAPPPRPSADQPDLSPYLRTRASFTSGRITYSLDAAYNLPDFDTIGYAVQLAQELLQGVAVRGDTLFWNPGQGHLPVFTQAAHGRSVASMHLAARDCLELEVASHNLRASGRSPTAALSFATEAGLAAGCPTESFDFLAAMPRPVPRAPWPTDLAGAAQALLRPGGVFLAAGTSTDVFRILESAHGFAMLESRKRFGCRAVLLRKT